MEYTNAIMNLLLENYIMLQAVGIFCCYRTCAILSESHENYKISISDLIYHFLATIQEGHTYTCFNQLQAGFNLSLPGNYTQTQHIFSSYICKLQCKLLLPHSTTTFLQRHNSYHLQMEIWLALNEYSTISYFCTLVASFSCLQDQFHSML